MTQLAVALIAAAVAIAGWVINHWLTNNREREARRLEAALKYTERQLEELYGPIAVMLLSSRRSFRDLLAGFGRKHVFEGDKPLSDEELRAWLFWVENDAMPRNGSIKNILMDKTHLIEGDWFPDSYVAFLDHHTSWTLDHLRWKTEDVPYPFHSKIDWPQEFVNEVLDTFQKLKRRHAEYLALQNPVSPSTVNPGISMDRAGVKADRYRR